MAARKFAFDAVFDIDPRDGASRKPTYSEDQVAERERAAFTEGENSALTRAAEAQTAAFEACAGAVARLIETLSSEAAGFRRVAAEIALAAARSASGRLVELHGAEAVEAALSECVAKLTDAPDIEARLAPDLAERAGEFLEEAAARAGFKGRVRIVPDERMSGADCRFSWDGGALETRREAALEAVAEIIDRHLRAADGDDPQLDMFPD